MHFSHLHLFGRLVGVVLVVLKVHLVVDRVANEEQLCVVSEAKREEEEEEEEEDLHRGW